MAKASLAAALALCVALPCAGADDAPAFARLSGSWVGKHRIEPVGQCGWSGDKESTAALDIVVSEDGEVVVKRQGAELGRGQVSSSWSVTIDNDNARAECGKKPRRYERHFDGLFTEKDGALYLELEGIDEPCPPGCRFRESFAVKRTEIEEQ
jgi:hypothetical protein